MPGDVCSYFCSRRHKWLWRFTHRTPQSSHCTVYATIIVGTENGLVFTRTFSLPITGDSHNRKSDKLVFKKAKPVTRRKCDQNESEAERNVR